MSRLLIDEPPLQVLPSLAGEIGLNEALALQQLHWLLGSRHPSVITLDDRRWLRATVNFWEDEFPFWSEATVKRVWASLREKGLVLTSRGREASTYTITYEAVDSLTDQNDPSAGSERSGRTDQIDPSLIKGTTRPTTREEQPVAGATVSTSEDDQVETLFPSPAAVTPEAKQDDGLIEMVWNHYVAIFDPPRKELSPSRQRLIDKALKEVAKTYDGAAYLNVCLDGLKIWRAKKPGDTSLSAIFATRPNGSALGDQLEFFHKEATSGGTATAPKNPSVLSGTITQKKREVVDMLAYPDSPDHKQRGLAAIEWLKDEVGQKPIINDGELQGWEAA